MKKEKGTKLLAARMVFALIAFGFTLISAWNGFNFYRVLFGLAMAILISATFEIARFTCLFRYMHSGKKLGALTIALYVITAAVCAFASINSFTAEVIKQSRLNDKAFQEQIHKIRQAYLKEAAGKFETYNRDIRYLENKVAKYSGSNYWKRRLSQVTANHEKFVTERDKFLNEKPASPEDWIKVQSAVLGLEIEESSQKSEAIISVKIALKELWGLDEITAQKIMGIIITLVVEISIFILALLSTKGNKSTAALNELKINKARLAKIHAIFGEKPVKRFIKSSMVYFNKTGKLPPPNRLGRDLRRIKLYLEDFDRDCLKELFLQ
ncbi:MAG: hypothetical protein KAW12_26200 [Candidatus Aminicenantes bacterium]|nr:hypothetical protein [Candidatus Aminicenantes bacterium]